MKLAECMFELFCLDPENDFFRAVTQMQYQNFWDHRNRKNSNFLFFPHGHFKCPG